MAGCAWEPDPTGNEPVVALYLPGDNVPDQVVRSTLERSCAFLIPSRGNTLKLLVAPGKVALIGIAEFEGYGGDGPAGSE
jgi:hypothetical protein